MAPIDLWGAPLNESLQIKHSKRSSASTFRVVSFGAGGFTGELISVVKQASQGVTHRAHFLGRDERIAALTQCCFGTHLGPILLQDFAFRKTGCRG